MDFPLPEMGEGIYEVECVGWLVQAGTPIKRGQTLMEVLSDKATMEVPSPFAGTITALFVAPGDKLKIGQSILSYTPSGAVAESKAPASDTPVTPPVPVPAAAPTSNGPSSAPLSVKAAPSVRQMARALGLDLGTVQGSGPQGRILLEDLTRQLPASGARPAPAAPKPDYGTPGTRLKLQGLRRKIAERMVQSKRLIPHYGYVDECNVTELVRLREMLKETTGQAGIKLTYLAFIVKAVVSALKAVPLVNASLEDAREEIVLHDRYHIGIAVAARQGLLVPVIHDADKLDLFQIAGAIERLSEAARTGKVKPEELRGGTFTVTSVGGIGGLFSTPVINHPEVGILGIGQVVKRPIYDKHGSLVPADMLYLSFSFDHRVVDGAVGAVFGNAVGQALQNPARLLVGELRR